MLYSKTRSWNHFAILTSSSIKLPYQKEINSQPRGFTLRSSTLIEKLRID